MVVVDEDDELDDDEEGGEDAMVRGRWGRLRERGYVGSYVRAGLRANASCVS